MKKLNVLFCAAALVMGAAGVANAAPLTPAPAQLTPAVGALTPAQQAYAADMMQRLNSTVATNPQLAAEQLKSDIQHFPVNATVDPTMCSMATQEIGKSIAQGNEILATNYTAPVDGWVKKMKLGAYMTAVGSAEAVVGTAYGSGCSSTVQTVMTGAKTALTAAVMALQM